MAVKLRLMRVGKTKQPSYRVVAADARSPRDGRFIEIVGQYNPRSEPSVVTIDNDKALKWLRQGAQPTERVQKLLEISGAWTEFKGREVVVSDVETFDADNLVPRTDGHRRARPRGAGTGRRPRLDPIEGVEGRRGDHPRGASGAWRHGPPDRQARPHRAEHPHRGAGGGDARRRLGRRRLRGLATCARRHVRSLLVRVTTEALVHVA